MTDFSERVLSQLENPREFNPSKKTIRMLGGKAIYIVTPLMSERRAVIHSLATASDSINTAEHLQTEAYPVGIIPANIFKWSYNFSKLSPVDRQDQLMVAWETLSWLDKRLKKSQDVYLVEIDRPSEIAPAINDAIMNDRFATNYDSRVSKLIDTVTSMDPLVNELHKLKQKVLTP